MAIEVVVTNAEVVAANALTLQRLLDERIKLQVQRITDRGGDEAGYIESAKVAYATDRDELRRLQLVRAKVALHSGEEGQ